MLKKTQSNVSHADILDDLLVEEISHSSKIPVFKKPIISLRSKYTLNKDEKIDGGKHEIWIKQISDEKIDGEKYVPKIKKTEPLESIDPPKIKPYSSNYYGSSYYQSKVRSQESQEEINLLLAQISSQLADLQIRMTVIENKLSKIENYAITDIEI